MIFTQHTQFTAHAGGSLVMAGAYSLPSLWTVMARYPQMIIITPGLYLQIVLIQWAMVKQIDH